MIAEPLVDVVDFDFAYRDGDRWTRVLHGLNFTISRGEVFGLVGESGCGKSTMASAVLRLLPATAKVSGQVLLGGEDVLAMSWGRLRAVRWSAASIVFQGAMHGLNPVRNIGAQIAEPILLHDRKATPHTAAVRVRELLEQVGVPDWRARAYPHELSGGQRQRVMIAMALACEPRLIIADEPTTALDVMVQAQVLALLRRLVRERGVGMMIISHDLSVLANSCDRVAVMYAGRVVEEGPGETLFNAAVHPYAKALAAAFPVIGDVASRRAPKGLPGDPPDPRDLPDGCSFHPRCDVAVPECKVVDIGLRVAGPSRRAACVHVGKETR
jgi:peptide/nickel transport system ATP-binding protein